MDPFDYSVKSTPRCEALPTQALTTTRPLGAHNAFHPERGGRMQFLISMTVIKTFHNLFVLFLSPMCCSFPLAPSSRRANQTPTTGRMADFGGRSVGNPRAGWCRKYFLRTHAAFRHSPNTEKKDFFPHVIIINFFLQRPENEALCKVICPFLFCRNPRLCDLACTPFFPDCFQAGGSSAASSYLLLGPTFLLHVAREFPRHERERLESRGVGGCWTITEHPGFRDDDDNCRIFSKV